MGCLAIGCLGGCNLIDFEEDCSYRGDVRVIFDWQHLIEGDDRPEEMFTTLYPDNSALSSYLLTGDTLLTSLAATRHDVLAYNRPENITFHDTDCPCTAYAALSTYTQDEKAYTVNAPALYAARRDITIPAFGETDCVLTSKPCFQQVYIDFVVIRSNMDEGVENLSGELSGVATRYSLDGMQAMEGEAILPFGTQKTGTDKYLAAMRCLGISAQAANLLDIELLLTGGSRYESRLDITHLLENFTAPTIYLTIEIRLSHLGVSMSIADWYTGEGGHIEL